MTSSLNRSQVTLLWTTFVVSLLYDPVVHVTPGWQDVPVCGRYVSDDVALLSGEVSRSQLLRQPAQLVRRVSARRHQYPADGGVMSGRQSQVMWSKVSRVP